MTKQKVIKVMEITTLALIMGVFIAGCGQKTQTGQGQKSDANTTVQTKAQSQAATNAIKSSSGGIKNDAVIQGNEDVVDVILDSDGETSEELGR